MRSIPLFFVAVLLTALQFAQAVPVDIKPADHTIEQLAVEPSLTSPLTSPLWSAKQIAAIDPQPAGDELKDEQSQPASTKQYTYADAHSAFEKCGKLCVLIVTDNCPPCEQAKTWFQTVALSKDAGACIVLHEVADKEYADEIKSDNEGFPQLVVYHAASGTDVDSGEPSRQVLIGYRDISTSGENIALSRSYSKQKTIAKNVSYQKCAGGCDSCPADCSANSCGCGVSHSAHAAGACCGGGGCGLVPGQPIRNAGKVLVGTARWFDEHRPVRKAVKGIAIGSAKIVRGAARGTAIVLFGRCRGCR